MSTKNLNFQVIDPKDDFAARCERAHLHSENMGQVNTSFDRMLKSSQGPRKNLNICTRKNLMVVLSKKRRRIADARCNV